MSHQTVNKEIKLSERLNLSFPYDWSNPNPDHDVFILNVLDRCYLEDIIKCINFFGLDRVKANYVNVTNEVSRKIAGRQLNNIEKAINEITQRNAS
jgi:hypothetical protein